MLVKCFPALSFHYKKSNKDLPKYQCIHSIAGTKDKYVFEIINGNKLDILVKCFPAFLFRFQKSDKDLPKYRRIYSIAFRKDKYVFKIINAIKIR